MIEIDKAIVKELWEAKEARDGAKITIQDVVRRANLNTHTVSSIKNGTIKRFDARTLSAFCDYFDVPDGPIPFLVYTRETAKKGKEAK